MAFSNGSGSYSRNSTTFAYIDQTNAKVNVNLRSGRLVRVDITAAGVYNSNTGYAVNFNVGVDNATAASTTQSISPASWSSNWDTTGGRRIVETLTFFLTNIGAGSKTIYALWATSNAVATVYMGQYGSNKITVTELL